VKVTNCVNSEYTKLAKNKMDKRREKGRGDRCTPYAEVCVCVCVCVQNGESENGERERAAANGEGEKRERFEGSDLPQIAPFAGVAL